MEIIYTARERFGPKDGKVWENYICWAQLPQLAEVIGLDTSLCPSLTRELATEDWQFIIQINNFSSYFSDLDYLIQRINKQIDTINILSVVYEPDGDSTELIKDKRFVFYGYDLIDPSTEISALTNCGGFEKAFDNSQLSSVGLLESYTLAREVQRLLQLHYPDEPHAYCDLWAIWRLEY